MKKIRLSFYFYFLLADESANQSSINAPGARRLSRSLSITVHSKGKKSGSEVKLKDQNPENVYNFKEEIGRYS
jgi:hypothetical protein